jgi:hypothetical protein
MTAKASEPRTEVKVTVSLREYIRKMAKKENTTMMEFIERKVRCDDL